MDETKPVVTEKDELDERVKSSLKAVCANFAKTIIRCNDHQKMFFFPNRISLQK